MTAAEGCGPQGKFQMLTATKAFATAGLLAALFATGSVFAQDAMAPDAMATDAMAPMATDSMAPMMSDDDLKMCVEQSMAITFPDVAMVAEAACHDLHNGHMPMAGDAMAGDAMAGDAMAPQK